MPRIVDYEIVAAELQSRKMKCVYPNGGAFQFEQSVEAFHCGWLAGDDATLRPEARAWATEIKPATTERLVELFSAAQSMLDVSETWIFPKSHWAHELQHGSHGWMDAALRSIDVDADQLRNRTTAAAISFSRDEFPLCSRFVQSLLDELRGSDFAAIFGDFPLYCTIHHHRQLWWSTAEKSLVERLNGLV